MRKRAMFHFDPSEPVGEITEAPIVEEPAAPAVEAPAETPWGGVSYDEWQQTQSFIQAAGPFLQNLAAEYQQRAYQEMQPPPAQLPEWDPFDENVVQAHFEHRVNSAIEQALAPYTGILGHVAQETSQKQAEMALERLTSEVGTFDRDAALLIAAPMIDSGQAPERALNAAARYMNELESRIRADERTRVQSELEALRGAGPGSTGGTPGVAATEFDKVPTGPRRYHEAVERAMARRSGSLPVG
jgi:hypothetical protein